MVKDNQEPTSSAADSGEKPEICARCKFYQVIVHNQQANIAIGACANKDGEEAPYGVCLMPLFSCSDFEERKVSQIVTPTKTIQRRLDGI
jgi:hypothetical protein